MLLCDNIVRRTDLDLRCYSIGLETMIYRLNQYHHVICCQNYEGDFCVLKSHFDESIRPLGYRIELTQAAPREYEKILPPILFSDVVDGFKGSYITQPEIEAAVASWFPDVDILGLEYTTGTNYSIVVNVAPETPAAQMEEMKRVLSNLDLGTNQIEVRCGEGKPLCEEKRDTPYTGFFKNAHLEVNKKLRFTVDEAEFWNTYAADIYKGVRKRDSIPKFYFNSTACFIDYTFPDQVDLRNVLLLYDIVYLVLPVEDKFDDFLAEQKMTRNELLELAVMGKVVFVLLGAEETCDTQFLIDAYACNPLSVLGRRGVNCLVAAFLCEMKEKFLSHFPRAIETARELFTYAQKNEDPSLLDLAKFFAWPIVGAAGSFRVLNINGPSVYGSFGLDSAVVPAHKDIDSERQESFRMFLNLAAQKTFVASALNATAFPSYPVEGNPLPPLSRFVSDLLQLYWYDAAALTSIQTARELPGRALSLFRCKENISITRVAVLADEYHTSEGFKRILADLGQLSERDCSMNLRMYNNLLFDLANVAPSTSKFDLLLSASSFFTLPPDVGVALNVLSGVKNAVCRTKTVQESAELKRIETCMKNAGLKPDRQIAENVHLLHKISPVVSLR